MTQNTYQINDNDFIIVDYYTSSDNEQEDYEIELENNDVKMTEDVILSEPEEW